MNKFKLNNLNLNTTGWFKEKIKEFLYFLLNSLIFINPKNRVSVLMYHSVGGVDELFNVKKEDFKWQMEYLKEKDYNIISLKKFIELREEEKVIYPKTIVITFDDGFEDNYYNVFPILKKYNFPVTIFLSTGGIRNFKIMNWEQVEEMDKSNLVDFQPHTVNHPKLAEISIEEAKKEILDSKKIIEEKLNKECKFFAYPSGSYNKEIINILKENGFKAGLTVKEGLNCSKRPVFELKRNFIYLYCGKDEFKGKLNYSVSFYDLFKKILK